MPLEIVEARTAAALQTPPARTASPSCVGRNRPPKPQAALAMRGREYAVTGGPVSGYLLVSSYFASLPSTLSFVLETQLTP